MQQEIPKQLGLCRNVQKERERTSCYAFGKIRAAKAVLDELAKLCGLEKTPEYIEVLRYFPHRRRRKRGGNDSV